MPSSPTWANAPKSIGDHTLHKELVVLRRALAEASTRGLWRGDARSLVPTIKVRYRPRERWLTPAQAFALLAELADGKALWAAIAIMAGLSLSEIEGLIWAHVDLKARRLRVPGTKRESRYRIVPIDPDLATRLRRHRGKSGPTDAVVSRWPNVRRDLRAAVVRANRRATEKATKARRKPPEPMPVVSPNDLRRTFASWLKQRGLDSYTVARLLGHSSTKMVELVYGKLDDRTFEAAIAKLPRIRAA